MNRTAQHPATAPGFTLVELLFVIGLIGVVLALTFPAINLLTGQVDTSSAINSVNGAITAARAIAVDFDGKQSARFFDIDGNGSGPDGEYSGAALVFTPAGEIRIVRNTPFAQTTGGNFLENDFTYEHNGYADVQELDTITLPKNAGVLAIIRNDAGASDAINLFTPPFALRFDEDGHLVPSAVSYSSANRSLTKLVFYDGSGDGAIDLSATRAHPWDPDTQDPEFTPSFANDPDNQTVQGQWVFRIEVLPCAAGLLIYDEKAFRDAGLTLVSENVEGGRLNSAARTWLLADSDNDRRLDNAQALFFNRYSGNIFDSRTD